MQRAFTVLLLLVVCLATLGSAATTTEAAGKKTTANSKSTTTPPNPQVVESAEVDTLAIQITNSILDRIQEEPSAFDWNKKWSGQELAEQFRPLHGWLADFCDNLLPNTTTDVAVKAIKGVDTWTYDTYFTVVFRSYWKYTVYMGDRIRYPGTDNGYLLLLDYKRLSQPVKDLASFYKLIYLAYDDFMSPKDFCDKLEALEVIWLNEVERFFQQHK